jgi:hypothetical protein
MKSLSVKITFNCNFFCGRLRELDFDPQAWICVDGSKNFLYIIRHGEKMLRNKQRLFI